MVKGIMGEVKEITRAELLQLVDPEMREAVEHLYRPGGGVVVYEVLQMDSSQVGRRSFLAYGPDRTYKTIEAAADGRLGDVPSRFAYPVAYAKS